MPRATVNKRVLDTLIRAKARNVAGDRVRPLPVAWHPRDERGSNWHVSGWTGGNEDVTRCVSRMQTYLEFLAEQFDVPDEG